MSEPIQPTPPVPPGPPAPPAPPTPPVPQYGEYAPAGYVPAQPAPGFEAAAAAQQPYGAASYPGQPLGGRRRKTWDVVLTSILLVVGLFGAFFGVVYGVLFSTPELLNEAMAQQGYPGFNGQPGAGPAVLIISHVVLYLIAVGGAIPLLISKRVAFWVPLGAGVVAAFFFWGTLIAIILSDPSFISQYSK